MKLKHLLWIAAYALAAIVNGCGAEAAFATARGARGGPWGPQSSVLAGICAGIGLYALEKWIRRRR